jgi:L-Ala-D/L-Glu epimerase
MTATKIEVEQRGTSTFGVENSRLRLAARETVSVRIRRKHAIGLGEACPLPGYGPDKIEEAMRALAATSTLTVPHFSEPGEIFEWVARRVSEHNSAARFALETALLDLLAQERRCPLWALFIEQSSVNTTIHHAALLPREDMLGAASRATAGGVRAFKLKVGFPDAMVHKLRGAFPQVPLRLDANGAFTTDQWTRFEAQLADVDLEFIEEPMRRKEIPWPRTSTLVALDESLQERHWTPALRDWALSPGNCAVFVLKPTTLGGWSRCLDLLKAAQRSAIRCVVSHTFGGGIEYAACHHLAVVCQQSHGLAAGLGPHPGLPASDDQFDPRRLAHAPGLGVEARVPETPQ